MVVPPWVPSSGSLSWVRCPSGAGACDVGREPLNSRDGAAAIQVHGIPAGCVERLATCGAQAVSSLPQLCRLLVKLGNSQDRLVCKLTKYQRDESAEL